MKILAVLTYDNTRLTSRQYSAFVMMFPDHRRPASRLFGMHTEHFQQALGKTISAACGRLESRGNEKEGKEKMLPCRLQRLGVTIHTEVLRTTLPSAPYTKSTNINQSITPMVPDTSKVERINREYFDAYDTSRILSS